MNYKQEIIDLFLYELQQLSKLKKIDQKQIYLQLINYGISEKEQLKDLSELFTIILNKYKNKLEITETNGIYYIKNKKQPMKAEKKKHIIKKNTKLLK